MPLFKTGPPAPLDGSSDEGDSVFPARSNHKHPIDIAAIAAAVAARDQDLSALATKEELENEARLRAAADASLASQLTAYELGNERAQRIAGDAALDAAKVNRVGDDSVSGTLTVGSSKPLDQAGTGDRVVMAGATGVQRAEAKAKWVPGNPNPSIAGGTAWTAVSDGLPTSPTYSIATDGNGMVWVGYQLNSNQMARSTDGGETWTLKTVTNSLGAVPVRGIAYGNGVWIVTFARTSGVSYARSTDGGDTWSIPATSFSYGAITYGNGKFVAFLTSSKCAVSSDGGLTWDTSGAALGAANSLYGDEPLGSVSYGGGLFVLCVEVASLGRSRAYTSTDGITWTLRLENTGVYMREAAYGNGAWIIPRGGASYYRSTDGAVWTEYATTGLANGFAAGFDGITHVVASPTEVARSTDGGLTWAKVSVSYQIHKFCAGGGLFLGVAGGYVLWADSGYRDPTIDALELQASANVRVLDHAGTSQRILTADAEGDYAPVSAVVWTGTWLQINAKDVAAVDTAGMIARTGAGTFATRTLTPPAAGITVANGDGVAGNPTLALANDLAALEGLATTGLVARTADGVAATRTITGTPNEVLVTNGNGVSGNPTIRVPGVAAVPVGPVTPPPAPPSSFGGFPRAPLAIPANQHRVTVVAHLLGA